MMNENSPIWLKHMPPCIACFKSRPAKTRPMMLLRGLKKSSTKEKSHTWGDWTLTGVVESTTFKVTDEANADKDFYYISKDEFWHATGKLTTKPFRAYLSTVRSVGARSLRIALADEPSAVKELSIDNCLALFGGHGELTVVAPRMMGISISTLGGMVVRRAVLQAGERLNVQLPKGVYVVNGVKVIVK